MMKQKQSLVVILVVLLFGVFGASIPNATASSSTLTVGITGVEIPPTTPTDLSI